jgi:hypothetical protein
VQHSSIPEDIILKQRLSIIVTAACLLLAAAPAVAQPYGPPVPRTGHAITDLRQARGFLSRGGPHGVTPDDQQAIGLIDQVLAACGRVVDFDRQRLHVQPEWTADTTATSPRRHENARLFLVAAQRDLSMHEADPSARPYLDQARRQLAEALSIVAQHEQSHM